jgi:predicted hotdog family 3-hydroxylacyl-ACP dehydratase
MQSPAITDLPAEQLTTHQAPALLVAGIVQCSGHGGRVHLKEHGGLDALQLIEAGAQALAVLMGARLRAQAGTPGASDRRAAGLLVGAKGFAIARAARPGERVEIAAEAVAELGALQLYRLRILVAGEQEIGAGELKVAALGAGA